MNPNAKMLALRDPAKAAMMGAIAGADFGMDAGFGYQFGADGAFGEDLVPTPQNMVQALTEKRERILNPNADSTAKTQRYVMGLSQAQVFGTAAPIVLSGRPRTKFRPQRLTANVPFPGLAYFKSMQVSNVGILVGGKIDAWDLIAEGIDEELDVPTLGSQDEVSVAGDFTAVFAAADPFATGNDFLLTLSLKGPASMVGG